MTVLVISCSLHPQSRSFVLAKRVVEALTELEADSRLIDLRDLDLAMCDATTAHKSADAQMLIEAIISAESILMAVPIYNFYANAAAKNVLEIAMRAFNDKIVGFLCAAGGRASYMSVMNIANSLMLDFRCHIIPRFVYATGDDFSNDRQADMVVSSEEIEGRIVELAEKAVWMGKALRQDGESGG